MKKNIKKLFISSAMLTIVALPTIVCTTTIENKKTSNITNSQALVLNNNLTSNVKTNTSSDQNKDQTESKKTEDKKWYKNKGWITVMACCGFVLILCIVLVGIIFKIRRQKIKNK